MEWKFAPDVWEAATGLTAEPPHQQQFRAGGPGLESMWLFLNNCPASFPTRARRLPLAPSEPLPRPAQRPPTLLPVLLFPGKGQQPD